MLFLAQVPNLVKDKTINKEFNLQPKNSYEMKRNEIGERKREMVKDDTELNIFSRRIN